MKSNQPNSISRRSQRPLDAVLTIAPRYENTARILDMAGMYGEAPLLNLSKGNDWSEDIKITNNRIKKGEGIFPLSYPVMNVMISCRSVVIS